MAFTKHARAEVVEIRHAPSRVKTASLESFSTLGVKLSAADADRKLDEILKDDGYLYVKVRAISSRTNRNADGWPAEELQKAYRTFIGKPTFIEHSNYDPKRARGVVVDSVLHVDEDGRTAALDPYYSSEECDPEHKPATWIECLMEVDAKSFPRLARAILTGEMDAVSMGANVGYTKCSHCGNRAEDAAEFCDHVRMKNSHWDYIRSDGTKISKKSYENCVPPGTMILMGDGTSKPVEDVAVGDEVTDHRGQRREVLEVMANHESEHLYAIHRTGQGRSRPLRVTGNHPVLMVRGGLKRQALVRALDEGTIDPEFVEASDVRAGDWVVEVHPDHKPAMNELRTASLVSTPERRNTPAEVDTSRDEVFRPTGARKDWIRRPCGICEQAMELRPSDAGRLFCSHECHGAYREGKHFHAHEDRHRVPASIPMGEDFGRWCGWFLAEGSIAYQATGTPSTVVFSLHRDEEEYAAEILRLGRSLFGLEGRQHFSKVAKSRAIHFGSRELAELMSHLGTSAYDKSLPTEWMSAPLAFINGVVRAHEKGDGHHNADGERPNEHLHLTSSESLADQLYQMNVWMGRTPSRRVDRPSPLNKRTVNGQVVAWSDTKVSGRPARGRIKYGPWNLAQVSAVEREAYDGPVHNLEVAESHVYVADGQAVHNCYEVGFFELSFVADPADETATFLSDPTPKVANRDETHVSVDEYHNSQCGHNDEGVTPDGAIKCHECDMVVMGDDNRAPDFPPAKTTAVDPMTGQTKCALCGTPTNGEEICATCQDTQTPEQQAVVQADPMARAQSMAKVISFKTDDAVEQFIREAAKPSIIDVLDALEVIFDKVEAGGFEMSDEYGRAVDLANEAHRIINSDDSGADYRTAAESLEQAVDALSVFLGSLPTDEFVDDLMALPDLKKITQESWARKPMLGDHEGSLRVADDRPKPPRGEELTAPPKVETLQQDKVCEICGSDMDGPSCAVCDWTAPPEGLDTPDLSKAEKVDEEMRKDQAEEDLEEESKQERPPAMPARGASSGAVSSEKTAGDKGGDSGRINVRERPILPPGARNSDHPLKVVTVSDQRRPVESSKGNDMRKKADGVETGADKRVDVTGVGGVDGDTSPLKVVDVEAVGGIVDEPTPKTQDVAKDTDVTGDATETWSKDEGAEAVTSESGEGLHTVSAATAGPTTEKPTSPMDVGEAGSEEVGDATDTWSDGSDQEKPVTSESGEELHTVASQARRHAFACMKLAEAEVQLGITDADDKYKRASEFEDERPEVIEAQLKTLAKVHTAGLRKQPLQRQSVAGPMPSMRTASAPIVSGTLDIEDSFFL